MIPYPTSCLCKRTYRMIQAYTAIRESTRVGAGLREMVGTGGDIGGIVPSALPSRFDSRDIPEARRLIQLANDNKRRIKHENNGQNSLSNN